MEPVPGQNPSTSNNNSGYDFSQSVIAEFGLTETDVTYLASKGKPILDALNELQALAQPRVSPEVQAPATLDNGFMKALTAEAVESALASFQTYIGNYEPVFVVPAAGAASRQFQLLKTVLNYPELQGRTVTEVFDIAQQRVQELSAIDSRDSGQAASLKLMTEVANNLARFWSEGLEQRKYAFADDLEVVMDAAGFSLDEALRRGDLELVASFVMNNSGLGYETKPKALMKFHAYPGEGESRESRFALEEHLRVGAQLFRDADSVRMHFIISEEHEDIFKGALEEIYFKANFRAHIRQFGFSDEHLNVTWDFQSPATDSVALNVQSRQVARDANGLPLLRKAGHGALLTNLARLENDGIWVQNVDNVLYDNPQVRNLVIAYKKVMAGLAFEAEEKAHRYIERLNDAFVGVGDVGSLNHEIVAVLRNDFCVEVPEALLQEPDPRVASRALLRILDRPITLAAYVPLAPGQAGGGPFVLESDLGDGIRITKVNTVEGSEFEGGQGNPVFRSGDFFNPVNLFLGKRKHTNERFDLEASADPDRCFVSEKTDPKGAPILAYERPGLWNGGLSGTLQVSIPTASNTFSAVKDCAGKESFLAEQHQPYDGAVFTELDEQRNVADDQVKQVLLANR